MVPAHAHVAARAPAAFGFDRRQGRGDAEVERARDDRAARYGLPLKRTALRPPSRTQRIFSAFSAGTVPVQP